MLSFATYVEDSKQFHNLDLVRRVLEFTSRLARKNGKIKKVSNHLNKEGLALDLHLDFNSYLLNRISLAKILRISILVLLILLKKKL